MCWKKSSRSAASRVVDLQLSRAARSDLAAIDEYSVEQFGHDLADAYLRRFGEVFDLLRRQPLVGVEQGKLGSGLRCFVNRKHRIFYSFDGERVLIVRILHHAQDVRRQLGH